MSRGMSQLTSCKLVSLFRVCHPIIAPTVKPSQLCSLMLRPIILFLLQTIFFSITAGRLVQIFELN